MYKKQALTKFEKRVLEKVRHGPPSHDGMLRFAYGSRQLEEISLAFLMRFVALTHQAGYPQSLIVDKQDSI